MIKPCLVTTDYSGTHGLQNVTQSFLCSCCCTENFSEDSRAKYILHLSPSNFVETNFACVLSNFLILAFAMKA